VLIFIPPNPSVEPTIYLNNDNYYYVRIEAFTYYSTSLILNNTVYNYITMVKHTWIIGVGYSFGMAIRSTENTDSRGYGPQEVIFRYSNGTTLSYTFPNIPSYVIINQPMAIDVHYNNTKYWVPLP